MESKEEHLKFHFFEHLKRATKNGRKLCNVEVNFLDFVKNTFWFLWKSYSRLCRSARWETHSSYTLVLPSSFAVKTVNILRFKTVKPNVDLVTAFLYSTGDALELQCHKLQLFQWFRFQWFRCFPTTSREKHCSLEEKLWKLQTVAVVQRSPL